MSTITDQILQAISPDPSLDLRQEIRVELVSLFSMDQQYERALDVAALGWACADRLLQERDDLRRAFCYASASERGSTWRDLPLVAARNWGRAVALALYPDGVAANHRAASAGPHWWSVPRGRALREVEERGGAVRTTQSYSAVWQPGDLESLANDESEQKMRDQGTAELVYADGVVFGVAHWWSGATGECWYAQATANRTVRTRGKTVAIVTRQLQRKIGEKR